MLSFCITIIIFYVGLAPHPSSYIGHKYNQQWWKTECKFGDKWQTRRPRAIASTNFMQNVHSIGRVATPVKPSTQVTVSGSRFSLGLCRCWSRHAKCARTLQTTTLPPHTHQFFDYTYCDSLRNHQLRQIRNWVRYFWDLILNAYWNGGNWCRSTCFILKFDPDNLFTEPIKYKKKFAYAR